MKKEIPKYLIIVLGSVLYAVATVAFIFPHSLLIGGTSGIAAVFGAYTPFSLGTVFVAINFLLIAIAMVVLGKGLTSKTFAGSALTAVFVGVFEKLIGGQAVIPSPFFSAIIGAVLIAAACGILFAVNSSSGGTYIIAMIVRKCAKRNMGRVPIIIDLVIVTLGGFLLGFMTFINSFLGFLLKTFGMDFVFCKIGRAWLSLKMDTVKINAKSVRMIAHRGVSGIERENTCPAFVEAGTRSYFGIETDVRITKDGKFVIIHDETTQRVTLDEYNINVEEKNYNEVKHIILPDLNGKKTRRDRKIPLLKEYIEVCKKYGKVCVLEIKSRFKETDICKMIEEIRETGYIDNVIFISFDLQNCVNIRKWLPKNGVQLLAKTVDSRLVRVLAKYKLDLDIHYKQVTKDIVKKLHQRGIAVNCWTCDKKAKAERLVRMGVDYITSNILE